MKEREREQVVEWLRCGADVLSLSKAGVAPRFATLEWEAWEAKRAIQSEFPNKPFSDDDDYRWLLLEAAQRVEEGSWP